MIHKLPSSCRTIRRIFTHFTPTVKPGRRRVQILMRKGGNELLGYMKQLVEDSALIQTPLQPEMDSSIDFLSVSYYYVTKTSMR